MSSRTLRWSPAWAAVPAGLLLRNPGAVYHAQFWAEDGPVWYAEAYAHGWRTLLWPHSGYLQTISRLGGIAAQAVPLSAAPLLFGVLALCVQAMPALVLLGERFAAVVPDQRARLVLAGLYVLVPDSYEVSGNLTNAQWHLAVLAFLLVVGPGGSGARRWGECGALPLCGLSGPFCLLLLPVAGWRWVRDRGDSLRLGVVACCAAIQASCLVATMGGTRSAAPLGAFGGVLARILVFRVELGAVLGQRFAAIAAAHAGIGVAWVLLGAGVWVAALALWRGPPVLRQFCAYAGLVLAAGLLAPQAAAAGPQWTSMLLANGAGRYFFIPMLAWLCLLLATAAGGTRPRWVVWGFAALLPLGVATDLVKQPFPDMGFAARAAAWRVAPVESVGVFPVPPVGFPAMVLVKR